LKKLLVEPEVQVNLPILPKQIIKEPVEKVISEPEIQGEAKKSDRVYSFKSHDPDVYFEKTVNGKVEFNQKHPFYNSVDFRERLMQYYISIEAYEKCADLVNLKTSA